MYNKIWSPLKQEFVDTLSYEGKRALKMYVNSFMTGGAEAAVANAIEQRLNDFYTAFKDNLKDSKELKKVLDAYKPDETTITSGNGDNIDIDFDKLVKILNISGQDIGKLDDGNNVTLSYDNIDNLQKIAGRLEYLVDKKKTDKYEPFFQNLIAKIKEVGAAAAGDAAGEEEEVGGGGNKAGAAAAEAEGAAAEEEAEAREAEGECLTKTQMTTIATNAKNFSDAINNVLGDGNPVGEGNSVGDGNPVGEGNSVGDGNSVEGEGN